MSQIRAFCLVFLAILHLGFAPFLSIECPSSLFVCEQLTPAQSTACPTRLNLPPEQPLSCPILGCFVLLKHPMHQFDCNDSPLLDRNCCQIYRFLPPLWEVVSLLFKLLTAQSQIGLVVRM